MKTEHLFEVELERKLSEKQFGGVLESLRCSSNEQVIKSNVWNLINTVCLTLKTKELLETDSDLEMCKQILLDLVERGSPKEVIVALMEEADSFKSHAYFCLLLDPLKQTLKKVPGRRGKSLEWVLSTLNAHIQTVALPQDLDLQDEEKLFLDTDPAVVDTNYVLTHYLQFLNAFVDEVSFEALKIKEDYYTDRIEHQRDILQKYILILLCHPFLYHDLHVESYSRPRSTIRTLCESCFRSLSKICCDVFNLYKYECSRIKKTEPESDDSDIVPTLAFSNLAYLIFVENLALDFQPFVYNHLYVFTRNLKFINALLSKTENLVLFKALHLSQNLLDRLEDFEITYNLVELEVFTEFPKLLLKVGIFSQIDVHRNMAIKVFLSYVSKCDWKGRYHLIIQVLCTANHSGAEGLVINLYKSYLHACLNGDLSNTYFLGKNLKSFLKKVYMLKDGVETDILENSDKIITALNLLRYLFLRDSRDVNQTGIWDMIGEISKNFIEPLSTGLDLSRAHYKQVAKDLENEKKREQKSINSSVTVNNQVLPNIPPHFQKEVIEKALLTFDMIESILSRARELI